MKRNIIYLLMLLAFITNSCTKDEGYDNNEYQINDPDHQPPGIGFPEAFNGKTTKSVNLISTLQTVEMPVVTLLGNPANQDIHVHVAFKQQLVDDYNATAEIPLETLSTDFYNFSSMVITIPKGSLSGGLTFNVPDASIIDGTKTYGFGFTIESIEEAGYTIASNTQDLLLEFAIKNDYDGYYQVKGYCYHPTYGDMYFDTEAAGFPCDEFSQLITSGPTSVNLSPGQALNSGGISYFSAVLPKFTIDPATNKVTVTSTNTTVFDPVTDYDNHYDPDTRTLYVKYGWSGSRIAIDTFVYCGPR